MNRHLSDEQFSQLLRDALPGPELAGAEHHLWNCAACRDALRYRTEPVAGLPPMPVPSPDGSGPVPAEPPDAPPAPPGYEIRGELGRGGMGVVWKARQLRPSRDVALKVLRAGLPSDLEARRRFRAEAEALARLQHPGIVQVYEVGEHEGRPFFSLEFCAGGSLANKLAGGPLPPAEAAALVEAVARAVGVAHRAGIVHRDLKPANLLLAADGTPKVTDFGLAKSLTQDGQQLSRSGTVLGTPAYAAPEQFDGAAGAAADVYALGAILYECLTGRPPFQAATVLETLALVRTREPVSVRQQQPGVPRDLETICLKCLEKEATHRYGSAEGLAGDLQRFREGRPVTARPVSRPERLRRWARRNPLTSGLAALLALALTAGLTTASALWWRAERHLGQEEAARREAEDRYLACRELLGEYVAVTRDPRTQDPAGRRAQRGALAKARAFCEGLRRQRPDDPGLRRDLAEVCTGLAALDAHDGRLEEAREAGETALAIWQEVGGGAAGDARGRDRLAAVLDTLGRVYYRLGHTQDSATALRQAIALWDGLAGEDTASLPPLLASCAARRELASVMVTLGRHGDEERLYADNCARLDRANAGGDSAPELRLELLTNVTALGQKYHHDLNRAEAARCWRRGYELGRRLAEEVPDNARAVFCLAVCARELAETAPTTAPPEETAGLCVQAARLLEARRQRDPADRDCVSELSSVYWSLADSYRQAGKVAEAGRVARRAVEVLADLADRRPSDLTAQLGALLGRAKLAVRERQCGGAGAARATARQVAAVFEQLCAARSADPAVVTLMAYTNYGGALSAPLRHAGASGESLRVAECSRRLFEKMVREDPDDPLHWIGLSEAWTQVAKTHWGEREHAETESALRAAVRAADELAERWIEYRPLHAERARRLGRFLEERGRTAESAAWIGLR
jgi:eukaryotic-like serine/threonine-protein kinase